MKLFDLMQNLCSTQDKHLYLLENAGLLDKSLCYLADKGHSLYVRTDDGVVRFDCNGTNGSGVTELKDKVPHPVTAEHIERLVQAKIKAIEGAFGDLADLGALTDEAGPRHLVIDTRLVPFDDLQHALAVLETDPFNELFQHERGVLMNLITTVQEQAVPILGEDLVYGPRPQAQADPV